MTSCSHSLPSLFCLGLVGSHLDLGFGGVEPGPLRFRAKFKITSVSGGSTELPEPVQTFEAAPFTRRVSPESGRTKVWV